MIKRQQKKFVYLMNKANEILALSGILFRLEKEEEKEKINKEMLKKAKTFSLKWRFADKEVCKSFSEVYPREVCFVLSVLGEKADEIKDGFKNLTRFERIWFKTNQKVRDFFEWSQPEKLHSIFCVSSFKNHRKEALILGANTDWIFYKKGGEQK